MHVCYFGSPTKRIFGVFDEPAADDASKGGVVLCYPHGADYGTAFRSFRILAARLARAGFHVLRFDYRGTGDSSGDIEEASIPQWIDDTVTAIRELERSREVREVSLVGLRLGAALAVLAAMECQRIDQLVLWEPVIDGREYVAMQRALHKSWLEEEIRDGREVLAGDDELLGYRITENLCSDLENVNLWSLANAPAPRILVVSKQPSQEYERLTEHLRARGARVDTECVDGPSIWSRTPVMDEPPVPASAIQVIVNWLAGSSR